MKSKKIGSVVEKSVFVVNAFGANFLTSQHLLIKYIYLVLKYILISCYNFLVPCGLEENNKLSIYFQRAQVNSKIGNKEIEDTQAVVVYSEKKEAPKDATLLEAYHRRLLILNIKYIPFEITCIDKKYLTEPPYTRA